MTANQINYAALKETQRSNRAKEEISRTSNTINQEHYLRADTAALSQARTAERNASINAYNADINAYNAMVNRMNAETNLKNARSNQTSAEASRLRAEAQSQLVPSQIALNEAKTNESLVSAWAQHPIASVGKFLADNAAGVVAKLTDVATSHPEEVTTGLRVMTGTTDTSLINTAVKGLLGLHGTVMPVGTRPIQVVGANERTGGRRHGNQ